MTKRLVSSEFNQIKRFAVFVSELNYFYDELKSHWAMIENGEQRIKTCLDESMKLFEDVLDTVPPTQVKALNSAMHDYRVIFVPKISPNGQNVVMSKDTAKQLVDMAHEQCRCCVKTPEEAEDCPVFNFSVGLVPPDTYDTLICPYSQAEWKD